MALGKALEFVKKATFDTSLRKQCYASNSKEDLLMTLDFNEAEFEDAINMQLVKCQTYEAAEYYQQLKIWFSLL